MAKAAPSSATSLPFNERTTMFNTVDRGGRTPLLANSNDGLDLRMLQ